MYLLLFLLFIMAILFRRLYFFVVSLLHFCLHCAGKCKMSESECALALMSSNEWLTRHFTCHPIIYLTLLSSLSLSFWILSLTTLFLFFSLPIFTVRVCVCSLMCICSHLHYWCGSEGLLKCFKANWCFLWSAKGSKLVSQHSEEKKQMSFQFCFFFFFHQPLYEPMHKRRWKQPFQDIHDWLKLNTYSFF